MVPRPASLCLLAAAFLLGGCPPPAPPDGGVVDAGVCGSGPPTLEVGTGASAFIPLQDGDPVTIINGPQGGSHIWGALRTCGLDPANVTINYKVYVIDSATQLSSTQFLIPLQADEGWWGTSGLTGFVWDASYVRNKQVLLIMEATDGNGVFASGQKRVVPQ
jgi:hypothetical protein